MESVQLQWIDIREHITEIAQTNLREAMELAGTEGAEYLKQISPRNPKGAKSGKYAKGWRSSTEEAVGRTGEVYIYNKDAWQLTHLLEDGHNVKNRFSKGSVIGWSPAIKHIYYAEGYVEDILQRSLRVSRGLY